MDVLTVMSLCMYLLHPFDQLIDNIFQEIIHVLIYLYLWLSSYFQIMVEFYQALALPAEPFQQN